MLDIIRNVGTPLDIDDVLRRILDTLFQVFPQADRGYVFLIEDDELQSSPCTAKQRVSNEDDPSTILGLRNNALAREVIAEGCPLLYTLADDSPSGRGEVPLGEPTRAMMAAPMKTPSNATVGVIQLETEDSGRQFIDQDLELLSSLGNLAGQLIEHAQLIEQNRHEAALAREHAVLDESQPAEGRVSGDARPRAAQSACSARHALAILATKEADAETLEWARNLMERQVNHMVRLVDDLLDVSRIERGKFTLRKERIELVKVIEGAVEASQPLIDSHGHRLEMDLASEPLSLDADPMRMAQVITNLLNNAAKYMEPGGRIWLSTKRDGERAVIRVRDAGIGIAADVLPRIFEPFTQAKQSLDRSQGGLGIGLSLVHKIVELHGGEVTADSGGPGKGSTFTIRLPLVSSIEFGSKPLAAQIDDPVARRVLVVDDQVSQAEVLAKLFTKHWGHDVAVAHDGPSAWASMHATRPEVVLMDIGLPGLDGLELARRMRAEPKFRDTLLVALTGYGQESDHDSSLEAGFDLHLVKPPSISTLKEVFAHPKLSGRS